MSLYVVVVLLKYEKSLASNVPLTSKLESIIVNDEVPLPITTDLERLLLFIFIFPEVDIIFVSVADVTFKILAAIISN